MFRNLFAEVSGVFADHGFAKKVAYAVAGIVLYAVVAVYAAFRDESYGMIPFYAAVVVMIVVSVRARTKVLRGTLTVFRNWADLVFSCTSIFSGIFAGYMHGGAVSEEGDATVYFVLMVVFVLLALASILWLVLGSFLNNPADVNAGLVAFATRVTVVFFTITVVGKIFEFFSPKEKEKSTKEIALDLAKLAVLGWMFNFFVIPMVHDNR